LPLVSGSCRVLGGLDAYIPGFLKTASAPFFMKKLLIIIAVLFGTAVIEILTMIYLLIAILCS
jgi:hypothetical protein